MKLNHLNIVVGNVAAATRFFETYFNFKCIEIKGDHIVAVLKGAGGFTLVIMKDKADSPDYPGGFHIGFMMDSEEEVIETYQRLKTAGFVSEQEPKKIRDSFGFYFTFENLMIEVGYYYENIKGID